jgi:hypothetical protein
VKFNARVDGLQQLSARLAAVADDASLAPDLQGTAEDIRERAAAHLAASGSSGALAQSLTVSPDNAGGYTVSTPLDYGWHLEFGSRTRAAKPWLAPATEAARLGLLARIGARLNAALRRLR